VSELTAPEGLRPLGSGKVRDLYEVDDGHLLLVASDRISAFDVVLDDPVPGKGEVLTALTVFWLDLLADLVPNHLAGWRASELPPAARHLAGRAMLVRRLEMVPFECVARGHLVGSGWKDYQATGTVCGIPLPPGLRQADRLPEPIFTPATKADEGHDENIDRERAAELVGRERLDEVERTAIALYRFACAHAAERGILIADTKFEFGLDPDGNLVLADEAFTPDSSRFWPADEYEAGRPQPSFDKQFVRDYCETLGWDKTDPGPELPEQVVAGTRARYVEAFERLTGVSFDDYLADPQVVLR